jgi:hypothetical protein
MTRAARKAALIQSRVKGSKVAKGATQVGVFRYRRARRTLLEFAHRRLMETT